MTIPPAEPADVPSPLDRSAPLDLEAITEKWLRQCAACDAGLSMSCTCPPGDPRNVISNLVDEVSRLRELWQQAAAIVADEGDVFETDQEVLDAIQAKDDIAANDTHASEVAESWRRTRTALNEARAGWRNETTLREALGGALSDLRTEVERHAGAQCPCDTNGECLARLYEWCQFATAPVTPASEAPVEKRTVCSADGNGACPRHTPDCPPGCAVAPTAASDEPVRVTWAEAGKVATDAFVAQEARRDALAEREAGTEAQEGAERRWSLSATDIGDGKVRIRATWDGNAKEQDVPISTRDWRSEILAVIRRGGYLVHLPDVDETPVPGVLADHLVDDLRLYDLAARADEPGPVGEGAALIAATEAELDDDTEAYLKAEAWEQTARTLAAALDQRPSADDEHGPSAVELLHQEATRYARERNRALSDLAELKEAAGLEPDTAVDFAVGAIRNMLDTARITRTQLRPQLARAEADAAEARQDVETLKAHEWKRLANGLRDRGWVADGDSVKSALRLIDAKEALIGEMTRGLAEVKSERDDYAARLKATDRSWAEISAERDDLAAKPEAEMNATDEARREAERLRRRADDIEKACDDHQTRLTGELDALRVQVAAIATECESAIAGAPIPRAGDIRSIGARLRSALAGSSDTTGGTE